MSGKKLKLLKKPLLTLSDPDKLENCEKTEEKNNLLLPFKKRVILNNGKENKSDISPRKGSSDILRDEETHSLRDSDSDSDMEDLMQSLKKKGIKTESKSTGKSSRVLKHEPSQKNVKKQLFTEKDENLGKSKLKLASATDHWIRTDCDLKKSSDGPLRTKCKRVLSEESDNGDSSLYVSPLKRRKKTSSAKKSSDNKNDELIVQLNSELEEANATFLKLLRQNWKESRSPKEELGLSTTPLKKRKSTAVTKLPKTSETSVQTEPPATPVLIKFEKSDASHGSRASPPPAIKTKKCATPRTPLEEARVSLHVAAVPNSLPCREQEYLNILSFVENKVIDGVGGCMYISGVPGTGKTATVTQVIRHLRNASQSGDVPDFKYIEINGMRLSDPRQAYVQLYQQIFNKKDRISSDAAHKKLDAYFNKADKKKMTTVILVDELDLMCTRKQDVVYNLLDWPTKPRSRLVVLTIANTMDMPERKLKGRVNSRLGLTRLTFLPYTHKQLEEIVMARLEGTNAFVLDAVRLATRKVAAVSGDARRALDICRRAAELPADDEPVRITHIEQAIKEMTNSNIVRLLRSCCTVEKMFLQCVSDVCVRTGLEEVDLLQVIEQLIPLCVLEGLQKPTIPSILSVCHRLKCSRLLFTSNYRSGLLQRLTLNVTQDDIHYAFKADA